MDDVRGRFLVPVRGDGDPRCRLHPAGTIGVTALALGIYFAYAIFAAYLGSRTGMTMPLLTRSIFGVTGSYIVSAMLVIGPLGWVGFQGGLMVQIWNGLYGWGAVELLTIIMCGVMIFNNLFGFTGISTFARYVVTPLIMLWVAYMVIRGLIDHSSALGAHPKNATGLTFWQVVGTVLGFAMWGNEPDIWRYGKPKFRWPIPAFAFALAVGFLLFTIGGWMMAQFAGSTDFGTVVRYSTHFSLFGAFWLAWILATISQFAINDGNYYEAINAFQNIFGNLRVWKRLYSCLICACIGALAGYLVNYVITNGFLKVAAFLAVTAPCATTIMVVDHFALPRLFGISRPLIRIPKWREASIGNWPAIVALGISVFYGAWATGIFPGENPNRYWGPGPLEAWVMAARAVHRVRRHQPRGRSRSTGAQAAARLLEGGRRHAASEQRRGEHRDDCRGKARPPNRLAERSRRFVVSAVGGAPVYDHIRQRQRDVMTTAADTRRAGGVGSGSHDPSLELPRLLADDRPRPGLELLGCGKAASTWTRWEGSSCAR